MKKNKNKNQKFKDFEILPENCFKTDYRDGEIDQIIKNINKIEIDFYNLKSRLKGIECWDFARYEIIHSLCIEKGLYSVRKKSNKNLIQKVPSIINYLLKTSRSLYTLFLIKFLPIEEIYISSRRFNEYFELDKANKKSVLLISNFYNKNFRLISKKVIDRIINTLSFLIFIPGYIDRDIEYISGLLDKNFKTNLNFKNIISKNYKKNIASIYFWKFLFYFFLNNLKQIKYINDNLQKGLVLLAYRNGINTLEIQHGYMGTSNDAFSYPKVSRHLFTIPKKTIVYFDSKDISYPSYIINKSNEEYEDKIITEKDKIEFDVLIGSTPTYARETEHIISLISNSNLRLALKLHPAESILEFNKEITDYIKIYDGNCRFSEIASKSLIYISVCQHSTTVFEAYKCNCEIIIFNTLGRKFSNIPDRVNPIYCYSSRSLNNLVSEIINFHNP